MSELTDHYWLPFTPNRDFHEHPKVVVAAQGIEYKAANGRTLLDGSSGLFCTSAGHARPEITQAVYRQLQELDFTPSFYRGHPKAFELARRLAALTPGSLDAVFFTNSGSEAVDTAMKIILAYHRAQGEGHRHLFISRERAYHGVGFGSGSLSGIVNNRRAFGPGVPSVAHLRHTQTEENRFAQGQPSHGADLADDLERLVRLHGADSIAAVFVEPIAGSTGVLVPPVGYLERIRELCDRHGILLVFDEVITGIGRTGYPFAAQAFGVTPDLLTLAKAVTNGAQPLGAVAVRSDIRDTVVEAQANRSAPEFFHGYTYSAHPASVAAGLAALEVYEKEGLFEKARDLSPYFLDALWSLKDLPIVVDLRGYGLLAGVEIASDGTPGNRGYEWQKRLFDTGLHVKTTGDSALVAPAFVYERRDVDRLVDLLRSTLRSF